MMTTLLKSHSFRFQGAYFAPWSTQVLGGTKYRERLMRAIVPGVIPFSSPPFPLPKGCSFRFVNF